MSLDLVLYACFSEVKPYSVHGRLPLFPNGDFIHQLRRRFSQAALLDGEVCFSLSEDHCFGRDSHGEPLRYVHPADLDDIHPELPHNRAALDFIRHNVFREDLIVVLYWR